MSCFVELFTKACAKQWLHEVVTGLESWSGAKSSSEVRGLMVRMTASQRFKTSVEQINSWAAGGPLKDAKVLV